MLDFSWSELMVVIVVAVLAVGPKQLPEVLHGLGKLMRRLQYMRYAVTRQFDDFMEQSDLKELRDSARILPTDYFDEAAADDSVMKALHLDPLGPTSSVTRQDIVDAVADADPATRGSRIENVSDEKSPGGKIQGTLDV